MGTLKNIDIVMKGDFLPLLGIKARSFGPNQPN